MNSVVFKQGLAVIGSLIAALIATLLLASCGAGGGTDQTAGVGGGGTGYAQGTTSGFGSIFVDGVRWDDSRASVEVEVDPRSAPSSGATVRLGQRVQLEYTTDCADDVNTTCSTTRIRIEADVIGRVVSVDAANQRFNVAGQLVQINTSANAGPVTVFAGGYSDISGITANDPVEVHGSARFDNTLSRYVIQAARVEKLGGLPANLTRVTGVVQQRSGAPQGSFKLGDLTVSVNASTNVAPANRSVTDGQRVVVWGASYTGGVNPTLVADAIRIRDVLPSSGNQRSQVSGVISRFDVNAGTFELDGFQVNAALARRVPANQTLADGLYVSVRGSFNASNVLVAEQVRIRQQPPEGEIDLVGPISSFANVGNFVVRGVPVDASSANVVPPSCTLQNGVNVTVRGALQNNRVVARQVRCTL